MNSRPIPEFTTSQITESIIHFMGENPDGGLRDHLVFAVQSDALLSGHKPPTDLEIGSVASHLSQYKVQDALIHVDPPTSDDWLHQRIPCDMADRIRRVLAETITGTATRPAWIDEKELMEIIEALRIKEK